ncbi:MAG: hypothetical protein ACTSO7_03950 [Candidatus Heimdallarchaeota archaeon]
MSFLSVLLGALIGGIVSTGALIGITFLGSMVPWWALLLIAVGGTLIGGFAAGLLARGAGAGALAGFLSGILVFVGVFLFTWLYFKAQIVNTISTLGTVDEMATELITLFGMAGTELGPAMHAWIVANVPNVDAIIDFANTKWIFFALIFGGIFGGIAAVTNLIAGLIGGLFTRKKDENYDSYY